MFELSAWSLRWPRSILASVLLVFIACASSSVLSATNESGQAGNEPIDSLRDPTLPLRYTSVERDQPLKLQSVLISGSRRLAIINGVSVNVGETIPGYPGLRLVAVQKGQVTLDNGSGKQTIKLLQ